jgi:hypothetical protein
MPAIGFDGTVDEAAASRIIAQHSYPVVEPGSWEVKAVTGQRAVTISAGSGGAAFVRDEATTAATLNLASPLPSPGRWYQVCREFDWVANVARFVALQGADTTAAPPSATPEVNAPSFRDRPGEIMHVELAWAWVELNTNRVVIFDRRLLPPTGRGHLIDRVRVPWDGDAADLDRSPRMLVEYLIEYPGQPFRLTLDAVCEVGGKSRGSRWDLQAGTGYRDAGTDFFNPMPQALLLTTARGFDQFDNNVIQQRVSMGVPSERIFYGPTRVGLQAAFVGAGFATGYITADEYREFHIGIWAA